MDANGQRVEIPPPATNQLKANLSPKTDFAVNRFEILKSPDD